MHYDTLGVVVWPDAERIADRLESIIPSLTYRQLVEHLPQLAQLGVLPEGSLPMMLVVVRLVDRRKILQSGMTSFELRDHLKKCRSAPDWKLAAWAVEEGLERAIGILAQAEAPTAVEASNESLARR